MKGSIIPHVPRRHFGSYGQLPMPFSFSPLHQDSVPSISPGSTTCVVPPGAGAVMVPEQHPYLPTGGHGSQGMPLWDWIRRVPM